jgi:hypothetical protein
MFAMLIVGITVSLDAKEDTEAKRNAERTAQQEMRQQRRAERLSEYEKFIDSLVLSRDFRFVPQTMQQLPAGVLRTIYNPSYEVAVWSGSVDVCMPFLKGYTPPYYPVVFNYVLPSVENYTTEQTSHGWIVSFSSNMFSANDYKFTFDISSHYGGAELTISSPFYNSVQYSGNILSN